MDWGSWLVSITYPLAHALMHAAAPQARGTRKRCLAVVGSLGVLKDENPFNPVLASWTVSLSTVNLFSPPCL